MNLKLKWIFKNKKINKIGSVLILVGFGLIVFCGVAAVVIDLARVYLESTRVEEAVEAVAMTVGRELALYRNQTNLSNTQEIAIKEVAISFARQNNLNISANNIVIAGNRAYIDGVKKIDYTFAKVIGFDSNEVFAQKVVEVDKDGNPRIIKRAQYPVMPWGIPHRELNEPYDPATKQITMTPDDIYSEVEKFTPGKEYVLKLGSGVTSGDSFVPDGAQVLIPMGSENNVNDQWSIGYKRAYGLVLWLLTPTERGGAGIENVKWLLNYRGGSFMFPYNPQLMMRLGALKFSGDGLFGTYGMFTALNDPITGRQLFPYVKYWIVNDPSVIISQTQTVLNLTTAPRIGVYSSGEDAVTRTLIDAGIPFDVFYDNEILNNILTQPYTNPEIPYTWLHLHHENFYDGSDSQVPVPMISIRDITNDQTGPPGGLLYVRGWNWTKYKDGNKFIRIFFGDQLMTPTLTNTYSGCSDGTDSYGPYVNANDNGNFEITFTVPMRTNGNYFVYARVGGTEGDQTSNYTTYTIVNSSITPTISAVNHIDLSNNVNTGVPIRVTGTGFGANQPGIIIKFSDMGQNVYKTSTYPLCEVSSSLIKADPNGRFEVIFYTPDVPDGTHEVYAQVDNYKSNYIQFLVNNYRTPTISISDNIGIPNSGPKGSILYVDGEGFVPNYTGIIIKFNSITMNISDTSKYSDDMVFGGMITSNADGKFQVRFTIPETINDGTYEVKAYAGFNSTSQSEYYIVKSVNTCEIEVYDLIGDPKIGLSGGEVICRGVYFPPSTNNIKILFDTIELTLIDTPTYVNDFVFPPDYKTIRSDVEGKFEVKFNVPNLPNGTYNVQAFINNQPSSNIVTYTIGNPIQTPQLVITDTNAPFNSGPANEVITVTGRGFSPFESNIQIFFDNQPMNLSFPPGYSGGAIIVDDNKITADSNGEFQVNFVIPIKRPSSYIIKASNNTKSTPNYMYAVQPISTFYLSALPDFSTINNAFHRNSIMYIKVISTELDYNLITDAKFSIECGYHTGSAKHVVSNINLTNNGDFTYTGFFNWQLYSNVHNGLWQINLYLKDSLGRIYNPSRTINITGTNVTTQSSIVSLNSNLLNENYGISRSSTIYYKIQSHLVEPSYIVEKSVKLYCAATWLGLGGTHYYNLTELTNNLDGTYSGSYSLSSISPACHYGLWYLVLKIRDSLAQTYEVPKELILFSNNTYLRAIVSKNPYFAETYDIRSDGRRSDTSAYTPYPIFNSNSTIYIAFNAAPPLASTKVNIASIASSTFRLQFSEFTDFPTGTYNTGASTPVEQRGKPKTVSTADFNLANNYNGIFTAEISLTSPAITSVKRSWDKYFRIIMTVKDTANVTATITTGAHEIDNTNSQPTNIVNLHQHNLTDQIKFYLTQKTENVIENFNLLKNIIFNIKPLFIAKLNNIYKKIQTLSTNNSIRNNSLFTFKDSEMFNDMLMLSTKDGFKTYLNTRLNNALKNYKHKYYENDNYKDIIENITFKNVQQKCSCGCNKKDHESIKNDKEVKDKISHSTFNNIMQKIIMPNYAIASSYRGKYDVVHKIRDWIVNGGYMFTMCYATETIDRTLACNRTGNLIGYNYTLAFENFDPTKDSPSASGAIDANDGVMTLVDQSNTYDKFLRPLAITQNHVTIFPAFSGATSAFKIQYIKRTTGPNNAPVHILAKVNDSVAKYIAAEYGNGWFTFLGGHDPRLVTTYRLILNNILVGSLSVNNPPTATSISHGILDFDNNDDGYSGDEQDYIQSVRYGYGNPLYGEIVTTYPGDLPNEPTVDSIPYCFEEATHNEIEKRYTNDLLTPRSDGSNTQRTYLDYLDGSSRFVLVPIVSNYYKNGAPTYTQSRNLANAPKYIYKLVGRDRVRIKGYALFYLSGNNANPNADPVLNEVGALKYGEVRAKFVGYLK